MTTSSIIFQVLVASFEPFNATKKHLTFSYLLIHKPQRALYKFHLQSFLINKKFDWFVALNPITHFSDETQKHKRLISTTSSTQLEAYVTQVVTRADTSLLRSSRMAPFTSLNKIVPRTLKPHNIMSLPTLLDGNEGKVQCSQLEWDL
jgi:hypothetical protein